MDITEASLKTSGIVRPRFYHTKQAPLQSFLSDRLKSRLLAIDSGPLLTAVERPCAMALYEWANKVASSAFGMPRSFRGR